MATEPKIVYILGKNLLESYPAVMESVQNLISERCTSAESQKAAGDFLAFWNSSWEDLGIEFEKAPRFCAFHNGNSGTASDTDRQITLVNIKKLASAVQQVGEYAGLISGLFVQGKKQEAAAPVTLDLSKLGVKVVVAESAK